MLRTNEEEVVNAATHFLAAVIVAAITLLVVFTATDPSRVLPLYVMGLTATWAFFSSFLYHSSQEKPTRKKNYLVDRAAIYIMIAGSGIGLTLAGSQSYISIACSVLLLFICALLTVKLCDRNQSSETYTVFSYVLFGWLAVLPSVGLITPSKFTAGPQFLYLLCGGLAYSIGVVFYIRDHIKWNHTIWHIFVILGFSLHIVGCYLCLA